MKYNWYVQHQFQQKYQKRKNHVNLIGKDDEEAKYFPKIPVAPYQWKYVVLLLMKHIATWIPQKIDFSMKHMERLTVWSEKGMLQNWTQDELDIHFIEAILPTQKHESPGQLPYILSL